MKKSSLLLPAECLPLEEQKIFVACSGGLDSMVLLDLLTRNNYQPTVLHVNYKLRGEESDLDQKLVEKYCLEHQLSNHIYQTNDSEVKALKSGNLQEKARTIRYTFFEKHLLVKANSLLYLGHHLDDQIETFFMRVLRKSGLTGMQLMKLKMDYKIRPFLNYHKEDLLLYAQEYQVPFRHDQSNFQSDYLRNWIRNEWMPLLNNSCPNLGEAIQTLTKAFQSTQEELLQRNKTLIEEIKENSCWPFSSFDSLSREERILVGRSLGWTVRDILELESKRNASKSTMHLSHNKQSIVKESTQWNWSEINQVAWKLNIKQVDLLPAEFAKNVIYLDGDKIIGELHLRFPKTGDKIFSIGLEGSQLVSKVLKDAKWELKQRQQALLLCDEKNIHWVHGLKVGRKALASAASQRILKITVEQSH